jgi:hypothetical protein
MEKKMMNKQIIQELASEILVSAIADEQKLKELDESIDPSSYGRTIHLAKTLIEYINEKE